MSQAQASLAALIADTEHLLRALRASPSWAERCARDPLAGELVVALTAAFDDVCRDCDDEPLPVRLTVALRLRERIAAMRLDAAPAAPAARPAPDSWG